MTKNHADEHAVAGSPASRIETFEPVPRVRDHGREPDAIGLPEDGAPDFGGITIRYEPKGRCAELKSLKEYFLAYRQVGIFYENAVNRILKDFVAATRPVWAEVTGEFSSRGGMRSIVRARTGRSPAGRPRLEDGAAQAPPGCRGLSDGPYRFVAARAHRAGELVGERDP
ncbi:MAG: NADPH-dependent 7-cyano-7-deazaguanine reductase QueF [Acidobacteriota bacterium]